MTVKEFLPVAARFWRMTRPELLPAFLDSWPTLPESERAAFIAYVRALRGALELHHVADCRLLDQVQDQATRDDLLTYLSWDVFADFSGQRYAPLLALTRAVDGEAPIEIALRLRGPKPGEIENMKEARDG